MHRSEEAYPLKVDEAFIKMSAIPVRTLPSNSHRPVHPRQQSFTKFQFSQVQQQWRNILLKDRWSFQKGCQQSANKKYPVQLPQTCSSLWTQISEIVQFCFTRNQRFLKCINSEETYFSRLDRLGRKSPTHLNKPAADSSSRSQTNWPCRQWVRKWNDLFSKMNMRVFQYIMANS